MKGQLLNTYVTETWQRPDGLRAPRDVDGNPLVHGADEQVLPPATGPRTAWRGRSWASSSHLRRANFGDSVDGNYGFGDGCFVPRRSTPADPASPGACDRPAPIVPAARRPRLPGRGRGPERRRHGRPLYKVTREEDINIVNGDEFVPQVPPPACAGPLHT